MPKAGHACANLNVRAGRPPIVLATAAEVPLSAANLALVRSLASLKSLQRLGAPMNRARRADASVGGVVDFHHEQR